MEKILIQDGILQGISFLPSPNFNQRPDRMPIQLIVVHNISLPPNQFGDGYIEQFFQNKLDWNLHPYFKEIEGMKVSAHVLILRTGQIIQFVNFNDRAWHAGRSSYLGLKECNDYSIGIELEGSDSQPFEKQQYQALAQVISSIYQAYPKTVNHLTGHSDIAPHRKTDPGEHFDWAYLRNRLAQEKE